jgi:hypothetical protein
MARQKVKVTVFGFGDEYGSLEVVSKERFEELVRERAVELSSNERELEDWLEENFTMLEVWDMTDSRKQEIMEHFKAKCLDWAYDELMEDWEQFEIETEIEVVCDCECHKED